MLTKTAIYKKYASLADYAEYAEAILRNLQKVFPNVQLRSFSEFKTFLDGLLPKLVHKYLINSGTMKNCSGISPDFAEISCQAGFPVLTQLVPGHQRNILLAQDGPYIVDLSYIQFTCKYDLSDKASRKEVVENYRALYKNPFKAIKIEKLPVESIGGLRQPHGEYSEVSPNPMEALNEYNIEETEEAFPERFDRFKS